MESNLININKKLPNGTDVSNLINLGGDWDIPSTLQHVAEYFKHGISVKEGDIVLDIGANIGIFALTVFDRCKENAVVHSFEPISDTFSVLKQNMEQYKSNNLKVYPFGISNITGDISFTHYPGAPGLSTHYPEYMRLGLEQMIANLEDNSCCESPLFTKNQSDNSGFNNDRMNRMRAVLGLRTVFQEVKVNCSVKTFSDFLKETNIDKIDLLKVDVNGSELDVFSGIEKYDWSKIRQLVTEIPSGGKHIDFVKNLLNKNGFTKINVEHQEPVVNNGLFYSIVYAIK